jgi:hypothetical protein
VSATTLSSEYGSAENYLENVCAVLPRAEKVTQLRLLVGLLGLEQSMETDRAIQKILTTAQQAPLFDEWTRIVSGLVESILFDGTCIEGEGHVESENDNDTLSKKREARELLEKTCAEIIAKVRKWKNILQ